MYMSNVATFFSVSVQYDKNFLYLSLTESYCENGHLYFYTYVLHTVKLFLNYKVNKFIIAT